ncbi:MAG TPA: enoyl-CoA hydratase-related protein [Acidimicrobiales bacterium]
MELVQVGLQHGEDESGAVGVVTLNDSARRNALSPQLVAEFIQALDELENNDEVKVIVITGTAPVFCAGADLGKLAAEQSGPRETDADKEKGLRSIYAAFLKVSNCSVPTIAAINGPVVGAGMNLALACDVRLCARSARFEARFLDLGLHPGGGQTFLLQRAVGVESANAMILFGERLSGEEAERRGLVWRCVDDEKLLDEALTLAMRRVSSPKDLLTTTKSTLAKTLTMDRHENAVDAELVPQMWSMGEPFFAQRLAELRASVSSKKS